MPSLKAGESGPWPWLLAASLATASVDLGFKVTIEASIFRRVPVRDLQVYKGSI